MVRDKSESVRRRIQQTMRRVGIWLDQWCLRGYCHDTHAWPSKMESLRSLKRTPKQRL